MAFGGLTTSKTPYVWALAIILVAAVGAVFDLRRGLGPPILWPVFYSSEAISMKIVDAVTKRAIDRAIIVARWRLHYRSEAVDLAAGNMMVLATSSAADGTAVLDGWGPKVRDNVHAVVESNQPEIIVFVPGYAPRLLRNELRSDDWTGSELISQWRNKTIEMSHLSSDMEYGKELGTFAHLFDDFPYSRWLWGRHEASQCEWRIAIPLIRAVEAERLRLAEAGVPKTLLPEPITVIAAEQASSAKEVAKCGELATAVRL